MSTLLALKFLVPFGAALAGYLSARVLIGRGPNLSIGEYEPCN